ncbi:MAG: hypothetical protein KC415_23495, partial [Anaerolineales bacterium]|nr:hypothetical protein [Anaerolineales bacterium]
RMASPDSIVPDPSNPQSYNCYSYVRNNPVNLVDPTGHRECGALDNCEENNISHLTPTVVIVGGSNPALGISQPGPTVKEQLPAWNSNPWGYNMVNVQYLGSKYGQYEDMLDMELGDPKVMVCYSAGAEACMLYASSHPSVETIALLGPTFTGADSEGGEDIGFEGWSGYMEQILINGTDIIIYDDGLRMDQDAYAWAKNAEENLKDAGIPSETALAYFYWPNSHYDSGRIKTGTNNNPRLASRLYYWINRVRSE